jgi:transposase
MREAPHLRMLFNPMMLAHSTLVTQVEFYDVQILKLAKGDETTRRLMTVPGVGPATALAFRSTIVDPNRFKSPSDVGAYLRLTPRRYQSDELDRTGRISKRGDRQTRLYLFEAASVLLSVVKRWTVVKAWVYGWPNASASRRPRPLSPASSLSFCIASGSTVPSFNGARRNYGVLEKVIAC